MVKVNGVPPIGFTRVAVIAETEQGVRMVYMLDPTQPVIVELEQTFDHFDTPYGDRYARPGPTKITLTGTSAGMNIWNGPMPGDPPEAIEPTRREIAS